MKANDFASDQYSASHLDKRTLLTGEQPHQRDLTVGELSREHPIYNHPRSNYDWNRLGAEVGQHGIEKPLQIGAGPRWDPGERLMNGHHRAIMAMDQGHMFVPVSHDPQPTGERDYRVVQSKPSMKWGPLMSESGPDPRERPVADPSQGHLFNDKQFKGPAI